MTKRITYYLAALIVSLAVSAQKALAYSEDTYYLVSPELTNNELKPEFAFSALRNRTGSFGNGQTDYRYFSLGLKRDDIEKTLKKLGKDGVKQIHYTIVNKSKSKVARPFTDNYLLGDGATTIYSEISPVKQELYKKVFQAGTGNNQWLLDISLIGSDKPAEATNQSYEWFLNIGGDQGELTLNTNRQLLADPNKTFYLIGNFKNSIGGSAWDPMNTADARIRMDRVIYPLGETDPAKADSILYTATVMRPSTGWGIPLYRSHCRNPAHRWMGQQRERRLALCHPA